MEDSRPGSQPEINTDYIDKLLSLPQDAQNAPVRKAADTPAADPEPETTVSESRKPMRRACLLILAAALLLLGFLAGSLVSREKQPENVTTPPATTLAPQFGLIPSYETWSTDTLAVMATKLPILWDTPLTPERFDELSRGYPMLAALKERADALDALQKILDNPQSDKDTTTAAQSLIAYINAHVPFIPPCRWLQMETQYFDIYEFSVEPLITVVPSTILNEPAKTILQFGAEAYAVEGEPEILKEECSFWFLLQRKEGKQVEPNSDDIRVLNDRVEEISDARSALIPCEEGWIVCGYAPSASLISVGYETSRPLSLPLKPSPSLPDNLSTEELLLKMVDLPVFRLYLLGTKPANFQYHPLMAALLEREDLIPTALQMAKNNPQGHYATLMVLLAHESVYAQMTETQKNAFEMLEAKRYWSGSRFYSSRPALAITGEYAVCDTYYLSASDAKTIRDTEADHWFLFGLSSGAIELNDGSWTLEIEEQGSSTLVPSTEKANILLWPAYHSRGDYAQVGWLIAVQGETPYLLRLTIRDGRGNILDAAEVTWVESSILTES